jgi:cell division transport system ATP-binding protein
VSIIPKRLEDNTEQDYMVQMFHVYKSFLPNRLVLENINLEARKGDFVVIAGPNGAGKSTLINLLAGQELPDKGEIIVNSRNLPRLRGNKLQLFRQTVGFLTQEQWFLPEETLYQNLALILLVQGAPQKKVHKRISETLSLVGLKDKLTSLPRQLSKGEQQLALLARSIIHEPVLLLADGLTCNLDSDNQILVTNLLERLNRGGMTIILTTREKTFDKSGYQRVIQLEKGRIVG